jgi:hypothetical protein
MKYRQRSKKKKKRRRHQQAQGNGTAPAADREELEGGSLLRIEPHTPPKPRAQQQSVPSAVDGFDPSDAAEVSSAFTASAHTNQISEEYLHANGLNGASVYDLRSLEREVDADLASADDDDLVPFEDDELEELLSPQPREGNANGSGSFDSYGGSFKNLGSALSGASFRSRASRASASFRNRNSRASGGSFRSRPSSSPGMSRPSTATSRFRMVASSSSFVSRASSFSRTSRTPETDRSGADDEGFAARLSRLERHTGDKLTRGVSTRASAEEEERLAAEKLDRKRPEMPRPTPVSDLRQVLGWLDKRLSPERIAAARASASESSPPKIDPKAAGIEGMLSKWKTRAVDKASARNLRASVMSLTAEEEAAAAARGSGGNGDGWLAELMGELQSEIQDSPQKEGRQSVWDRQSELELSVDAKIRQRKEERRTRRAAQRRAREERRQQMGMNASDESSDERDDDEEEEAPPWETRQGGGAVRRNSVQRRRSASFKDESVVRFRDQLPLLEEHRREAKQACVEAEQQLREELGRKPSENERRNNDAWCRAAMAFKEADTAVFVTKSLCSWDE